MAPTLVELVAGFGLPAVMVLITLDSAGVPLPSEVIIPAAGAFAAAGHLWLPAVILVSVLACLAGALTSYWLAASFGVAVLLGPGRWIGLRQRHLELATDFFARHGPGTVLVGRVVPVVRGYVSYPAGLARMPVLKFSALTLAGSLPWCAGLALAGYLLGTGYGRVGGTIGRVTLVFAVLVAVLLAVWFARGRRPSQTRK